MIRAVLALAALAAPAFAQVDELKSIRTASDLGTIIGSEDGCGLALDPGAIQAFIAAEVDPADTSFAGSLDVMVRTAGRQFGDMSASARIAHCAAVTQSARHYGLVK